MYKILLSHRYCQHCYGCQDFTFRIRLSTLCMPEEDVVVHTGTCRHVYTRALLLHSQMHLQVAVTLKWLTMELPTHQECPPRSCGGLSMYRSLEDSDTRVAVVNTVSHSRGRKTHSPIHWCTRYTEQRYVKYPCGASSLKLV